MRPAPVTGLDVAVDWDARTDKGGRDDNQDAVAVVSRTCADIPERGRLIVVCDGVGGEAGGRLASTRAVEAALHAYYDAAHGMSPIDWLDAAIRRAHLAVLRAATTDATLRRMSTTLVAAAILDDRAYIAHVGDSRAYLFHDGSLRQLTRDHRNDATNAITRSLGAGANHDAEFLSQPVQLWPGDRVMLCTDGVYTALDDATMADVMRRCRGATDAANRLIGLAVQRGTDDNVSAAVFDYGAPAMAPIPAKLRRWLVPALVGAVLVLGAVAFALSALWQPDVPGSSGASSAASATPADADALRTPEPRITEQPANVSATGTAVPTFAPIIERTQQAVQTTQAGARATNAAALKTRQAAIPPTATPTVPPQEPPPQPPSQPPQEQPPPPPPEAPTATPAPDTPAPDTPVPSTPTQAPPSEPTQPPPEPTQEPEPTDPGDPGDPGQPRNGG